MTDLVAAHHATCDGFARVAHRVGPRQWDLPTPCTEWDARAVVEHVIGFHDFLLLRPLGIRAHRPRVGPAERWDATSAALFAALEDDGQLDRSTDLPGGGQSTPRTMLAALTTDVLVHTWDLARAAGLPPDLDEEACSRAYDAAFAAGMGGPTDMYHAAVATENGGDAASRLVALLGRDPAWVPPRARGHP